MHIGFRTSGGGRGEFELVGDHGPLRAADLAGWTLKWDLPGIGVCETGIWVDPGESGKPRLRSKVPNERPQVGRQIAAILLLPRPVRERRSLASTFPVLRDRKYFLSKIGFKSDSEFDEDSKVLVAKPAYVVVENQDTSDTIVFDSRWKRVQKIHDSYMVNQDHVELLSILQEHQDSCDARDISRRIVLCSQELNRFLEEQGDVIPIIEEIFHITPGDPSILGLEEIEEDDIPMRVKSTSEMRQVRARSSSARNFSLAVRNAWRHTCAFCGLKLPGRTGEFDSGVDAAHILPWSKYDLDKVHNGICLCKIHHWAFDQAVLTLRCVGDEYFVESSPRMESFDSSTQSELQKTVGPIPENRLPLNVDNRPSSQYINILNTDIDVSKLTS